MGKQPGAGRPEITIDWEKVNKLLQAGCKGTEVAANIGIHADTLYIQCEKKFGVNFTDYSAKQRGNGDSLLRTKQFSVALKGDKTMLVWLGKQRLAQRDKFDHDHTTGGEKIQTVNVTSIAPEQLDDLLDAHLSKRTDRK